jgi:hypothetical protein
VRKWKKRYLGLDPYYHRKGPGGVTAHRDKLMDGWRRLTEGDDLRTVYVACRKYGVPLDVVFLALGESHWNKNAASPARASGPWQFVPGTAEDYGLIKVVDGKTVSDDRSDVAASTDAAIRMLRDGYRLTKAWDRKYDLDPSDITEDDRWAYVFWYYNRGSKVRKDYHRFGGKAAPYSRALAANSPRTGKYESSQYVVKLCGIREAIAHMHQHGWFESLHEPSPAAVMPERKPDVGPLPADTAYEALKREESKLSWQERLQRLAAVADLYEKAGKSGKASEEYVDVALELVAEEIRAIRVAHAGELRSETAQGSTKVTAAVDAEGESSVTVDIAGESVEASVVDYEILPGDRLNDIAIRLSGDPNKTALVRRTIRALNPDIKDINVIVLGSTIQVPGEYITVPRVKLTALLEKYYPGVDAADALRYIKYLNGLNHDRGDKISPGDVILVPAIR